MIKETMLLVLSEEIMENMIRLSGTKYEQEDLAETVLGKITQDPVVFFRLCRDYGVDLESIEKIVIEIEFREEIYKFILKVIKEKRYPKKEYEYYISKFISEVMEIKLKDSILSATEIDFLLREKDFGHFVKSNFPILDWTKKYKTKKIKINIKKRIIEKFSKELLRDIEAFSKFLEGV